MTAIKSETPLVIDPWGPADKTRVNLTDERTKRQLGKESRKERRKEDCILDEEHHRGNAARFRSDLFSSKRTAAGVSLNNLCESEAFSMKRVAPNRSRGSVNQDVAVLKQRRTE